MPTRKRPKRYVRKTKGPLPPQRRGKRNLEVTPDQYTAINLYFQLNNCIKSVATAMDKKYLTVVDWFQKDNVKAEIRKHNALIEKKTGHTVEVAMNEAAEAREFAREHKNANAFTKSVELRSKIAGHLVDKIEHKGTMPFSLVFEGFEPPKVKSIEVAEVKQIATAPPVENEILDEDEELLRM